MARANVFQKVQLGKETVPGTAVAANRRLLAFMFRPKPNIPVNFFRPSGSRFNTVATVGKEWTEFDVSGEMAYNDLLYFFSSLIKAPTGGSPYTMKMSPDVQDTFNTFTIEYGEAGGNCERCTYGVATGCTLTFNRNSSEFSGTMIARTMESGATITPTPTKVKKLPVNSAKVDVLVGDTVAGLTKITRALETSIEISDARNGLFVLDSAQSSFVETVERAGNYRANLSVQYDSTAVGYMADLRSSKEKYIRISVVGAEYNPVGPLNYSLQITAPFSFEENSPGENEDIYAANFSLQLIEDSAGTVASGIEVVISTDTPLP